MFPRNLSKLLEEWKKAPRRKPLILRGARQVGKTTLIESFGASFEKVVSLNLERSSTRQHWENDPTPRELIRSLEIASRTEINPGKTLLFLDEIQEEPRAIYSLRYLYEQIPDLHVIASGSLLEVSLQEKGFSFPVGRVSFLYLHPLSFDEFLIAVGDEKLCNELKTYTLRTSIPPVIHELALKRFREYLYVGGMPESVRSFVNKGSYLALQEVREGLMSSFEEDVPKYARRAQVEALKLLIQEAPLYAGQNVHYENFAQSGMKSRPMKRGFELLEQAMILTRVAGAPQVVPPLHPNRRVSPKILFLDVGLVSHRLKVDLKGIEQGDLNDHFRGALTEQVVGQELIAAEALRREIPLFWYRNSPGSSAEVDYILSVDNTLIPIEVKSGKSGKLKSLQQFMEATNHHTAVRMYGGALSMEEITTPGGKKIQLHSIPYYLTWRLRQLLPKQT